MSLFLIFASSLALGQDIGVWKGDTVVNSKHDPVGIDYEQSALALETTGVDVDFVTVGIDEHGNPDVTKLDKLASALTDAGYPIRLVAMWETYTNTNQKHDPEAWLDDLSTLLDAIDDLGHSQIDGFAIHELHKDTVDFNHPTGRWTLDEIGDITDTINDYGLLHLAYIPADYRALMHLDEPILLGCNEQNRSKDDAVWVEAEVPIPSGVQADSAVLSFSYATERNARVELSVQVEQDGVETQVWTTEPLDVSTPNVHNEVLDLSPLTLGSSTSPPIVRLVVRSTQTSNNTVPVFISDLNVAVEYPSGAPEATAIGEWDDSIFSVAPEEGDVVAPLFGGEDTKVEGDDDEEGFVWTISAFEGLVDVGSAYDDGSAWTSPAFEGMDKVGPAYDDGTVRIKVDDFSTFGADIAGYPIWDGTSPILDGTSPHYAEQTHLALNAYIDGLFSVLPGSDALDDATYTADPHIPSEAFLWIDKHISETKPRYAAIRALDFNDWSNTRWYTWEEGIFAEVLSHLKEANVTAPVVYHAPVALAHPSDGAFSQKIGVGDTMFEAYFAFQTNLPGHYQELRAESTTEAITRLFIWDGDTENHPYRMQVIVDDGSGEQILWDQTLAVTEGEEDSDGDCLNDGIDDNFVYPHGEVSGLHQYKQRCMREVDLSDFANNQIPAGSIVSFRVTQVLARSGSSGDKLAFLPACEDEDGQDSACTLDTGVWTFSSWVDLQDWDELVNEYPSDIYDAMLNY